MRDSLTQSITVFEEVKLDSENQMIMLIYRRDVGFDVHIYYYQV